MKVFVVITDEGDADYEVEVFKDAADADEYVERKEQQAETHWCDMRVNCYVAEVREKREGK